MGLVTYALRVPSRPTHETSDILRGEWEGTLDGLQSTDERIDRGPVVALSNAAVEARTRRALTGAGLPARKRRGAISLALVLVVASTALALTSAPAAHAAVHQRQAYSVLWGTHTQAAMVRGTEARAAIIGGINARTLSVQKFAAVRNVAGHAAVHQRRAYSVLWGD